MFAIGRQEARPKTSVGKPKTIAALIGHGGPAGSDLVRHVDEREAALLWPDGLAAVGAPPGLQRIRGDRMSAAKRENAAAGTK
jgi:hypothetical protein